MANQLSNSRRKVLKTIGATGALLTAGSGRVLAADTGEQYPEVDATIYNKTVRGIASVNGLTDVPGVAKHPSQDRVAFISSRGESALDLFIAEGIQSKEDKANKVYRITDSPKAGVYGPKWIGENYLSFQKNLKRCAVDIPQSYEVEEEVVLNENVTESKGAEPALPSIPTPNAIPFTVCVPTGRDQWCVNTDPMTIGEPRDCNSGRTPPLASASVSVTHKVLGWDGFDVVSTLSFWAGVEEDLNGVWVGTPDGECARFHIDPPSPTAAVDDIVDEINDVKGDILDWIDEQGGPSRGSIGSEIIGVLLLIVIAIIIADGVPDPI
ncbi:hypothetical protein [Halostagnicola kamekurae]|uniref:Uncharacterized protein n=1 Tax=Halostagnicola kamekurae TaxID=619731 RepID=A0A1I6S7L5_9EURY|nr:hypothetical protein [Halostagnicola kamekurae]SFS72926.1 hypothetical protein SAMN04488556_2473 [Halostagnicola kamekurae]